MASNKPYQLNFNKIVEPQISKLALEDLREAQVHMKDMVRCEEASFMNNDKKAIYNVIKETVGDIVHMKRGRGRPVGSKKKDIDPNETRLRITNEKVELDFMK